MRILTAVLFCLAITLACTSQSWAVGHHKSVQKQAQKDIKKVRKQAAKKDRPKLLHHHK